MIKSTKETVRDPDTKGLSPNVIVRLKDQWSQEYDDWSRRDLTQKHYLYVWADGIYVNARLEDTENQRHPLGLGHVGWALAVTVRTTVRSPPFSLFGVN